MPDDDFPIDPDQRVITFPCFVVKSHAGTAYAYHPLGPNHPNQYVAVILTDKDTLDAYRHSIDQPERGAARFNTPAELLMALRSMPEVVVGVCFDLVFRHSRTLHNLRPLRREWVCE